MVKPGPDTFPQSLPAVQTYERMQQAFPGSAPAGQRGRQGRDVNSKEMQSAIQQLRQQAVATGRMHEPITVDVNDDGTVAEIAVRSMARAPTHLEGVSRAAAQRDRAGHGRRCRRRRGRRHRCGRPVEGQHGRDDGEPPHRRRVRAPARLLADARRVPLARDRGEGDRPQPARRRLYGVLVLVFQHGYGSDFLGFTPTGGIDPVVPLLLFVILFGLSMDYHVFLLSRIREAVQRGATTDEAVARASSRRPVSSPARPSSWSASSRCSRPLDADVQAVRYRARDAILIDATIVRGVLLPASMKLLGDWNWYLPRWLSGCPGSMCPSRESPLETDPTPVAAPAAVATRRRRNRRSLVGPAFGALPGGGRGARAPGYERHL